MQIAYETRLNSVIVYAPFRPWYNTHVRFCCSTLNCTYVSAFALQACFGFNVRLTACTATYQRFSHGSALHMVRVYVAYF